MTKKFTFYRNATVSETYVVEADTEEEALQSLYDGCHDPVDTEWIQWDGGYELEDVEEIEPLYKMVKDYKCDTTS